MFYVDSTLFDVLDINFLRGNQKHAFTKPNEALITESIAKKYFRDEDPIGKVLILEKYAKLKVRYY